MSFFLLRLLLAIAFLFPSISNAQSLEERSAALIDARNSLHASLDALPFRKLRLDFSSLGSEAFLAEEVRLEAFVDRRFDREYGHLLNASSRFEILRSYSDIDSVVEAYLSTLIARYEPQTSPEKLVVIPPFDLPFENELEVTGVSFGEDLKVATPFWLEQDQLTELLVRPERLGREVRHRYNQIVRPRQLGMEVYHRDGFVAQTRA